jgi:hypothetical protein
MSSSVRSVVISALLLTLACLSIAAAAVGRFEPGIVQTLVFIAGLMSMGFLTSLSKTNDVTATRVELAFSPSLARVAVDEAIPAEFEEIRERAIWDLSAQELMAEDPTLALAKVRIDIEREVRRIASEASLRSNRPLIQMINEIFKLGLLTPPIFQALRNVLNPMNQAIHGLKVDRDQALEVFNLGNDLSRYLSSIRGMQDRAAAPSQNENSAD